jgi:hypothetical protein
VREHFRGDLGLIVLKKLRSALRTFLRARRLMIDNRSDGGGRWKLLKKCLVTKGLGKCLERVLLSRCVPEEPIHEALRQGALSSLKFIALNLMNETHRASLTQGFLGAMHELKVEVLINRKRENEGAQLAALSLVRQLPSWRELMASGKLPALAELCVALRGWWVGAEGVKTRVAPAFAAVAGTLTNLYLGAEGKDVQWDEMLKMGYEFGVAVGKLRRLKDLALYLPGQGRFYEAVAQGLAASGEAHPLPLLWRVGVFAMGGNVDLHTSLLLPSVRVLVTPYFVDDQAILLMACALRQKGYKHVWAFQCRSAGNEALARGIAQCECGLFSSHDALWSASLREHMYRLKSSGRW